MAACPNCGSETPVGAAFCPTCGTALDPAERPREERKFVSVLFVDLVGFTARSDRADPEDVRDILQRVPRARRSGRSSGSGARSRSSSATPSWPSSARPWRTATTPSARSARASASRCDRGAEPASPDPDLAVRAAVNTGEAVVAIGRAGDGRGARAGRRREHRLAAADLRADRAGSRRRGDVPRDATRDPLPRARAGRGQGEARAGRGVARDRSRSARRPNDRRDARRSSAAARARRSWTRSGSAPLAERRPAPGHVVGPTGHRQDRGSRRSSRAASRATAGAAVRGRCLPYGETGYRAFVEQVHAVARDLRDRTPRRGARGSWRARVATLLGPDEADDIALAPRDRSSGSGPDEHGRTTRRRSSSRRGGSSSSSALEQPTLLVFEDIHWADTAQLDLLEYLASHVRDAPACSSRSHAPSCSKCARLGQRRPRRIRRSRWSRCRPIDAGVDRLLPPVGRRRPVVGRAARRGRRGEPAVHRGARRLAAGAGRRPTSCR